MEEKLKVEHAYYAHILLFQFLIGRAEMGPGEFRRYGMGRYSVSML
jgi:hypothetical protein